MKTSILKAAALPAALLLAAQASADDAVETLLAKGRLDQAVTVLETRLGQNPYDPAALNNLAVVQARNRDYEAALALLRRAGQLAPDDATIRENYAALSQWLGNRAEWRQTSVAQLNTAPSSELPVPPPLW